MQPVITRDTQRDITALLQDAGQQHVFDPIGFLAGAIAESNLNERATRERAWPDVSYGLFQPAVAFLGPEVAGLTRGPDRRVEDTPANRQAARDFCFDASRLIPYVAPRYAALLLRWGTALEAWCRWNAPAIPGNLNPNQGAYARALTRAEAFRSEATVLESLVVPEPDIVWIGAHPVNFAVGRGGIKPEAVVLHIAEGSLAGVDSWFNQIHPEDIGPSSAHFCVGKSGVLHQYVNTRNTAFANGRVEAGHTAQLVEDNAGLDPNRWTISVEHEGLSGDQVPEPQFNTSTLLTAWLFQNRLLPLGASGVAVDRDHILGHWEISPQSRARCPGWSESLFTRYIERVQALLGLR